ncbi:heme/copper-type cytochrome/quinol oxidases, subunit 2 [Thermobacillus composti KWC4]|uniref:Heme/copper-type cytochrome/quinol oxidases, subunit 2 n=1 Tax=Thermobacillus composti (strain DSM 18247 / JCM 13945 / KWC4) TaxID=717605 RepID=L0EAT9_THECK|nr:cupredoxin domain-containing protein [Thermobacillus composti]AGA57363.1 heme/copper-type cytochrome/quinol oxidases, subunit 2 [Thermobacillus composti KWC4]
MKKWLKMLCLAVGVSMIISACGGGNSDNAGSSNSGSGNSSSGSEQSASSGETKSFEIKAKNWAFEPTEIRVNKGDTVEIKLVNEEGFHEVEIKGYGKKIKADESITFTADQTGEFDFICSVFCGTGHDDMIGKLIVE